MVSQFIDVFALVDSDATTDSDKSNEMKKEESLSQPQVLKLEIINLIRIFYNCPGEDNNEDFFKLSLHFVEKELCKID